MIETKIHLALLLIVNIQLEPISSYLYFPEREYSPRELQLKQALINATSFRQPRGPVPSDPNCQLVEFGILYIHNNIVANISFEYDYNRFPYPIYHFTYCQGTCRNWKTSLRHATTRHAQLRDMLHHKYPVTGGIPPACCVPIGYSYFPNKIKFDDAGVIKQLSFYDIIPDSCGCR